jgi:endonuclease/exonuclease/phosphatase family metal-dependent hydrolase
MRVVTYNVSGGLDPEAAGTVLRSLEPQIVCLLEAPGPTRLRTIARTAALEVAERSGRRGSGAAVLVHPDARVRATSRVPLTVPRGVPRREAAHVIVGVGGLGLSVTAVQFGLRPEVRRTNLDELVTFLRSIDLPTVVGCDLNESVRSPVAAAMADLYQDAHAVAGVGSGLTYPTADPSTRQDFVFVDAELRVVACTVPDVPEVTVASHHRPVVVDLLAGDDTSVVDRPVPPRVAAPLEESP